MVVLQEQYSEGRSCAQLRVKARHVLSPGSARQVFMESENILSSSHPGGAYPVGKRLIEASLLLQLLFSHPLSFLPSWLAGSSAAPVSHIP